MTNDADKLAAAAAELKDTITDAKAKLLLKLEAALIVGYQMRKAQNTYWRAKTGKKELLIDAKRIENAFDLRCAELIREGVDLNRQRNRNGTNQGRTGRTNVSTTD